jgi:diadenosine tetraphosphate (Ap4A) HIT family hydrolase
VYHDYYLLKTMKPTNLITAIVAFGLGIACGGYLFASSTPRSFLALNDCQKRCFDSNELAGLIASSAILRAPFIVPWVVMESDTCLAIRYPKHDTRVHYVLFPKHDTRNITTMTAQDWPFVIGCFALARRLVAQDKLKSYRLQTNGPGMQDIAYLHFHLIDFNNASSSSGRPRSGLPAAGNHPTKRMTPRHE